MIYRYVLSSSRFVDLLDITGFHERNKKPIFQRITDAARVSYDGESRGYEEDKKLLKYLITNNHDSPLEMIDFTFRIKCSIFTARQVFRHRISSFNEQSGRYTKFKQEFYIPKTFNYQSESNKQGRAEIHENSDLYMQEYIQQCANALTLYHNMIDGGVSKEQARMVLPVSMLTSFVWKVNLRSLINFINLRSDPHAQKEIREISDTIKYEILRSYIPEVYELLEGLD